MDGVVILESFEVTTAWVESFSWGGVFLGGLTFAFLGAILGAVIAVIVLEAKQDEFLSDKKEAKICLVSFGVPVLLGLIFGLTRGGYLFPKVTPTEYETQYKLVLEDNVNYKEFTDKYEIIDFENNVYTVRKK